MSSSWRDRHRRNLIKFRLTDIPCCKRVDSSIHKSKKPCLAPEFRHSNEILKLIKVSSSFSEDKNPRSSIASSAVHQDKQRKLFHINDYDNPTRLKECYVRLCRNLASFNAEIYVVKELHAKRAKRKVCVHQLPLAARHSSVPRAIDFYAYVRIKSVCWT